MIRTIIVANGLVTAYSGTRAEMLRLYRKLSRLWNDSNSNLVPITQWVYNDDSELHVVVDRLDDGWKGPWYTDGSVRLVSGRSLEDIVFSYKVIQ